MVANAIGMIVAAIIGAVVSTGTAVAGAVVDKNAAEDANKRSMQIYEQQREDEARMRKENLRIAELDKKWQKNFQQQQFAFGVSEAAKTRKENKAQLSYQKRQTQMQNTLGIINSIPQARSTFVEMFNRRKAA